MVVRIQGHFDDDDDSCTKQQLADWLAEALEDYIGCTASIKMTVIEE